MPKLAVTTNLQKVYLPSTAKEADEQNKAWVVLNTGALSPRDILEADPSGGQMKITVHMLASRIKEWNFTDDSGERVVIDFDSVTRLDLEDFTFLAGAIDSEVTGLDAEQKKTSIEVS